MYSELKFYKTSTAGNTSLLIENRKCISEKFILNTLFRKGNVDAEQIGFINYANNSVELTMAGKELCGGAILASPILMNESELTIKTNNLQIKTRCFSNDRNKKKYETMFPRTILMNSKRKAQFKEIDGYLVEMEGISYFVTNNPKIKTEFNLRSFNLLDTILNTKLSPALGIILVEKNNIKPVVWVKKVNTLILENGCTTGSIAAQATFPNSNENYWTQPSGEVINVDISKNYVKVISTVELLSSGSVFLNDR